MATPLSPIAPANPPTATYFRRLGFLRPAESAAAQRLHDEDVAGVHLDLAPCPSTERRSHPRSTSLKSSMRTPSSSMVVLSGGIDPGVMAARRDPEEDVASALVEHRRDHGNIIDHGRVAAPDQLHQRAHLMADGDLGEADLAGERRRLLVRRVAIAVHEDDAAARILWS
jgi:hypothetical protein